MSQLTRLHELNGKLDMLQDLKISGLGLSLEQQEKLHTHTNKYLTNVLNY